MAVKTSSTASWLLAATLCSGLAVPGAQGAESSGNDLIAASCGKCHEPDSHGAIPRISTIRKTPEGWDMSVSRMERWHDVHVQQAARAAIVKYLADTQGLAPSESAPFRYALEQRPGVVETHADAELGEFCARCHSMARPGLQRRDTAEWKKLINTHVGQWPSLEFHQKSRDRDWWTLANTKIADKLGKLWAFNSPDWSAWKGHATPALAGDWVVSGHEPGRGDYTGTLAVAGGEKDHFTLSYDLTYADGSHVTASGKALVYTGYEWRGSVSRGGVDVREIFTLSPDGHRLSGRWFDVVHQELGGELTAVKTGASPTLISVAPVAAKTGANVVFALAGAGLSGPVDLGPGIKVIKTETRPWGLSVTTVVEAGAPKGRHNVTVAGKALPGAVAVYDKIDHVVVEPAYTIARIGDGGGPIPRHYAQFEAIGYLNGSDGKTGAGDDIRLGPVPAQWSISDFDAGAQALHDSEFAGTIDGKGLFTPGEAGPNPKRTFKTNNVGNLKVSAAVNNDAGTPVAGESHLIVTVQRWVDGWIR